MTDKNETPLVRWWRGVKIRGEERSAKWNHMPPDKKGVLLIGCGCVAMLAALYFPFIGFDATYASPTLNASWRPPTLPVYPMGESIALADWGYPMLTMIQAALCSVFAARFAYRRTAPSYWIMWVCAVMCSFDAVVALLALWPGAMGYVLWASAAYENVWGFDWAFDHTQAAMTNGMFDFWDRVTIFEARDAMIVASIPTLLFLGGAWELRKVRVADKVALYEHRMRILNENQRDDYV